MISDDHLHAIASRLVEVGGVRAVVLGGSRARGTHAPDSDVDLGVYYRAPLDVAALAVLARELHGPDASVGAPGDWGPWVDGGAWLQVDGTALDWIYRDIDRVRISCEDAVAGRVTWHFQVGHPLGYPSFGYAAELATAVVLADPSDVVTELRAQYLATYPPTLAQSLNGCLWDAEFMISGARKAAPRGDVAYVAGCLFRAVGLLAHALHGHAGVWVTNEKGLVASADSLASAPERFADRVREIFRLVEPDASAALDAAEQLRVDVAARLNR